MKRKSYDNRIKDGLKCCSNNVSCMKCPYYEHCDTQYTCEGLLMADALAYIQQMEVGIDKTHEMVNALLPKVKALAAKVEAVFPDK